jgi:hypothetical protein
VQQHLSRKWQSQQSQGGSQYDKREFFPGVRHCLLLGKLVGGIFVAIPLSISER